MVEVSIIFQSKRLHSCSILGIALAKIPGKATQFPRLRHHRFKKALQIILDLTGPTNIVMTSESK